MTGTEPIGGLAEQPCRLIAMGRTHINRQVEEDRAWQIKDRDR